MKLETFFEKFDLLAEAPGGVAKLRELILQAAVDGRIVEQDQNEGSGSELLGKLVTFKAEHSLGGRSGRSKGGGVAVAAKTRSLPLNWAVTTIGEVLHVIRGASPRPKGDPRYFSKTRTPYHWVKISDIRKHAVGGLLMDTDEFVTDAGMRKSVLLPKGTLVMTNSATIGVPVVLGIEGCCIHDGYLAFPQFPEALLRQEFFLIVLRTLKGHAELSARGLAQLNLNTDLVRSFSFGLPPLAEQRRIVAKVNALMALCDRLEAQQQERESRRATLAQAALTRFAEAPTPANLNFLFHDSYSIEPADLRRCLTELAIQGKLLPQNAADRPVSVPARAGESGSPTATTWPPFPVPASWSWIRIADLRPDFQNGISSRGDRAGAPVVVIRLADVSGRRLSLQGTREIPITPSRIPKYALQEGDVLVTRVNGSADLVGSFVPVEGDLSAIYCDHFIRMRVDRMLIDSQFLTLVGSSRVVRDQIAGLFVSTAGQKTVNQEHIRSLSFPLPPLSEQRRIVTEVSELMLRVDRLDAQRAAAHAAGERLAAALVAEATGRP